MDDIDPAKLASAIGALSDDDKFGLFEQQAAYEGLDLEQLDDTKLASAYGTFIEDYLPLVVVNDGNPIDMSKVAEQEEAAAKLAEADILGRQMARSFAEELGWDKAANKELTSRLSAAANRDAFMNRLNRRTSGPQSPAPNSRAGTARRMQGGTLPPPAPGEITPSWSKGFDKVRRREALKNPTKSLGPRYRAGLRKAIDAAEKNPRTAKALAAGAGIVGLAGAGLGAKKLHDRKKAASAFDELALQRAEDLLKEAQGPTLDDALDARAIEILEANGYVFE